MEKIGKSVRPVNRRSMIILLVITGLLSLPGIAMLFTPEVRWSPYDFIIAGFILLATGFLVEISLRKLQSKTSRLIALTSLFVFLILLWLELSVGIFGSPVAGS